MRLLLDTHLLLWALAEPARLSDQVRQIIVDPQSEVLFSAASIWEVAIKTGLGRPGFAVRPERVATEAIARGFVELAVHWRAAAAVADLPLHHKDPFDRIIVAQAMTEPAYLYTVDRKLERYSHFIRLAWT
jgi:PIN domain nuclease of toxin-antitoxin system